MVDTDERPYTGLNALDMSQGIAGPNCAVLLGLYGAKVIKIGPPAGDCIWRRGDCGAGACGPGDSGELT
jgi:crotonobetainyl-CoA:carnitine CoA-transferase CaiB-like acyl-CoA transferase